MRYFYVILAIVSLFVFVFQVPIAGTRVSGAKILALAGAILLFFKKSRSLFEHKEVAVYIFLCVILLIIGVFSIVRVGNYDGLAILPLLMIFETLLGSSVVIFLLNKAQKSGANVNLFHILFFSSIIQSFFVIFMGFSEEFRDGVYGFMGVSRRHDILLNSGGLRTGGLSADVTFGFAVTQSIGLMASVFVFKANQSRFSIAAFLVAVFGVFWSIMVSARTGLIGALIAIGLFFCKLRAIEKKRLGRSSIVKILTWGVLPILITGVLVFGVFFTNDQQVLLQNTLSFAFEAFYKLAMTGKFETNSTNALMNRHLFVPNFFTILFGDGFYSDPMSPKRYYMDTDIGYLRCILFFGLLGSFCLYSIYFYAFLIAYRKANLLGIPYLRLFLACLFCYLMLCQLKGNLLLTMDGPGKILILFFMQTLNAKISLWNSRLQIVK